MDLSSMLLLLQQWVGEQIIIAVPVLLLSLVFLFKIHRVWSKPHPYNKLPPSPPRLPIIGNLHQLGTVAHRSFRDLSQKYGPLMFLYLGQSPPTLVVSSVEMAKEIMKNQDLVFASRPSNTASHTLLYGCTDIALAPYGEYWRQVKKISVVELLSIKRVQSFKHVRVEEVDIVIDKISGSCSSRNHGAQQVVNLTEILLTLTNNVISRCALGVKFETAHGNRFPKLSIEFFELLSAFCFADFFPYLGWIDVARGLHGKFKKASQELDVFLDQVIDEHLLRHTELEDDHGRIQDSDKLDLTDILILSQENYKNLSRDNIKAILLDMFLGGSETSARTMEWAMAELIKNPDVMRKAQDEVRRVVGNKRKVEEDDVHQMDYLKCIVKEILRLHTVIPALLPRETTKSTQLAGYDIPAKTKVFINVWAIHRDSNVWDDAEEFRPERFMNSQIDYKGLDFELLPFGSGRRGCPGIAFATAIVEYTLANLLYCFNWELPDGETREELDMTEIFGLTAGKKTPIHVVPTVYSSP